MQSKDETTGTICRRNARIRALLAAVRRGQAMVEFATAATIVLIVGIQFALIGQAALAVGQLSFAGARYASVNTSYNQPQILNCMAQAGSPTIASINGANLAIAATRGTNSYGTNFGHPVTVAISNNAAGQPVVANSFLGITFPATLTASETAMQE